MSILVPNKMPGELEARSTSERTGHQNNQRGRAGVVEVHERALHWLCANPPCAPSSAQKHTGITSATTTYSLSRFYVPPFCRKGRVVGLLQNDDAADTVTIDVEVVWNGNTRTASHDVVISASSTPTMFEIPIELADADTALTMTGAQAYASLDLTIAGDTLSATVVEALAWIPDPLTVLGA